KKHEPLEPDNQYCKHCGEAMFAMTSANDPCRGYKIPATPNSMQCIDCEDMAECLDAVKFLDDDATCIRARSNRLLDAKDIDYNSMSFMDRWAYPTIVVAIVFICIYAGYQLFTFDGPIF
ncbi:MAG: hypothetical protein KAJ19_19465, partial [Gammaproteobacteria bacterium]|nr:hypothetical protein [Gammaproteobacteria bacterium]